MYLTVDKILMDRISGYRGPQPLVVIPKRNVPKSDFSINKKTGIIII